MPSDWATLFGRDFFGRVRYRRLFQKLTGLESGERAFLVVEPPRSRGLISLSGKPLGEVVWGGPPARFDITDLLEDHNRLEIVVEHPVLDGPRPLTTMTSHNRPAAWWARCDWKSKNSFTTETRRARRKKNAVSLPRSTNRWNSRLLLAPPGK